jgi:hypothetical protein
VRPVPIYEGEINETLPPPDGFRDRDPASEPLDLIREWHHRPLTVVAFGSAGVDPATDGEAYWGFRETLADLEANKLFLRDHYQCWYLNGIRGLSRGVGETARRLRTLVAGSERVVTIGTSAGGYAAILYGGLMGADKIVALGPQSLLQPGIQAHAHGNLYLLKFLDPKDLVFCDLNSIPLPGPIEIHYGEDDGVDAWHAERLSDRMNVTLRPHPGDHSSVFRWLRDEGMVQEMLG